MSSPRKRKLSAKTRVDEEEEPTVKKLKPCDRRSCQETYTDLPYCFCHATERCAKDGNTSRWYHLSAGQHYCNECFEYFYRSQKAGNKLYKQWCSIWEKEAGDKIPPRATQFMADMWLPVYVQCTDEKCLRWRKLPSHIELHHVKQDLVKCNDCTIPEDKVVIMARDPLWVHTISYTPLLRYSEGLASLLTEYFPEGVGISPPTVCHQRKRDLEGDKKPSDFISVTTEESPPSYDALHPFNHPKEGPRAGAFTPDVMEQEEIEAFPEWTKSPALEVYLILRNIILALWFHNCKQCVTVEQCMSVLGLRGVVRVWCAQQLTRVLHFMSRRGYVNHGLMCSGVPYPLSFLQQLQNKSSVVIIGAGPSGISAARHLTNFGYQVKILEASSRIGGRVNDDSRFGHAIGIGAMFITGIVNNPLTVLVKQCDLKLLPVQEDHCELLLETGVIADRGTDSKVEYQFNMNLDKLAEWREADPQDISLYDKLEEIHHNLLDLQSTTYSKDERGLLDFHYSNLEFACGADLSKVSACYWDHNDMFSQFAGSHALISTGMMDILHRLCGTLDVKYNTRVTKVNVKDKVEVMCGNGDVYEADKVIVTIPLSLLKSQCIKFTPELSHQKLRSIRQLGAGLVEKVALKFPFPFWREKLGNTDLFGHVTYSTEKRGMFGIFYDLSVDGRDDTSPDYKCYILMTTISGKALEKYNQLTDSEVISECICVLRALFPDQSVPECVSYILSRWGRDPNVMMSYSYVGVGGNGDDYDVMSEEELGAIYFAGEATNRQHPQSVTGACLSGIREACKIIEYDYYTDMINRK